MTKHAYIELGLAVLNTEADAISALTSRLDQSFHEACERILACDPDALAIAKRGVQYGATHTMAEALAQEQDALGKLRDARARRREG